MQMTLAKMRADSVAGGPSHLRGVLASQPGGGIYAYLIIAGVCCALIAWVTFFYFSPGIGSSQDEERNPVVDKTEGEGHFSGFNEDSTVGNFAEEATPVSTLSQEEADAEVGVDGQKGDYYSVFKIQVKGKGLSKGQFQQNEF